MPRWVKVDYCPLENGQFLTFWKVKRLGFKGYLEGHLIVTLLDSKSNPIRKVQIYPGCQDYRDTVKNLVPSMDKKCSELLFSEDRQIREIVASLKWEDK